MHAVVLAHPADFDGWRKAARALAMADTPPEQVVWSVRQTEDLFAEPDLPIPPAAPGASFNVARPLVDLAQQVIQAADPERFALLYRLIWRAHAGEKHIAEDVADADVARASRLAQAVRRDIHKMHAFVRFREVPTETGTRFAAWFEPTHYTLEAGAPFFMRRFATMRWSILTPYRSAHWDGETLAFGPGADPAALPGDDGMAAYWKTYFRAIFNPARLKIDAMRSEMPKKYWRNLPEAAAIPDMIRTAASRTQTMVANPMISPDRAPSPNLPAAPRPTADTPYAQLRQDAEACRRCDLWQHATQLVFGEGPLDAKIMLVGEQPGDQEDLGGRPFIGPAGQLLDRALAEAGIDRTTVYVTNAVKHFKFTPRGKRRIHEKPDTSEIKACNVWLDAERAQVQPALTVLMGASAARAVLGRTVTIGRERGQPITLAGNTTGFVTVHPSYLLRLPDEAAKALEYSKFVDELRAAAALV